MPSRSPSTGYRGQTTTGGQAAANAAAKAASGESTKARLSMDRSPNTSGAAAAAAAARTTQYGQATSTDSLIKQNLTLLDKQWNNFYSYARGHLLNKYQVGMIGPYVEEALRVMDQNSYGDKYTGNAKTYAGIPFRHETFKQWLDMHYDKTTNILSMFWEASQVTLPSAKVESAAFNIDTVKSGMNYKLATGVSTPSPLQITVVDDPYFMWYNFFNALFNVQFSPLVLKPRSTWQKIQIFVDVLQEATTNGYTNSHETITGMMPSQMWEFNSCVLQAAPDMKVSHSEANLYSFTASFDYPNAFQGTCKEEFRYLRDNTTDGTAMDDSKNRTGNSSWVDAPNTAYGRFNEPFFEEPYKDVINQKKTYRFEALQKPRYNSFGQKQLPPI